MGRVDRNWTNSGGSFFLPWPWLLVGELAQSHTTRNDAVPGGRVAISTAPDPQGQIGWTCSRIRTQL